MSLISELSSRLGERTEDGNRRVAQRCREKPELLDEIAPALGSVDLALLGDAAEVMTMVAETHPEAVAPYAEALFRLTTHPKSRVRWEAMHAVSWIAPWVPERVEGILPQLDRQIGEDASVIVRDKAVDTVSRFATTSPEAARKAYPILLKALLAFEGKQAARALKGLEGVVAREPAFREPVSRIVEDYADDSRGTVKRAARQLKRVLDAHA